MAPLRVGTLDIPDEKLKNFKPFLQGGLGFAYLDEDDRRGDDSDIGILINAGFGLDYELTDKLTFGTNMLFNWIPAEINDEKFYFAWELASLRISF